MNMSTKETNEEMELPCAGKLAFDSQKEAQAAANFARWSHGTELKLYQCKHCSLWHLSGL